MPAPKTPPDSLRTTCTLTRPSAWPPRARRPPRPLVRLTQAFRDCPGQVLSRRMPGVVGPSPLTPHGPPFGPVQDVPVEGTTAGGPSVTDGRIVSAGRSAVRLSRGSSPFAETHPRRLPPVSRDHGLRLRLMSAASRRLPLSRFCRANLEPWAIVPLVRAVRSREVNTSGPSPRVKLTGPQSGSFGRGASPPRLSFRPPAAKPGCCPPSDSKF